MTMSRDARQHQAARTSEANQLYEQFGKPLETDHLGKLVAISPDGQTLVGENVTELVGDAADTFGPGNYIFRIGPRALGAWCEKSGTKPAIRELLTREIRQMRKHG